MSAHLSALVLDELAAGLPIDAEAKAHLETCDDCRARLAALQTARERSRASFGYGRTLARVSTPPTSTTWRWWALLLVPAAAAVLFLVVPRTSVDDGSRLKGAPTLELVGTAGSAVTHAHPGDHLKLKLGTGGFTHALVLAVDDQKSVDQLWPASGSDDRLPAGGVVTLPRELEVTPGSVTVYALFSNAGIDAAQAKADVPGAVRAAAGSATQRLDVSP